MPWIVSQIVILLTLSGNGLQVSAQTDLEPFEIARPGYSFAFPKDHGAHPAYKIEWWYFTGNLSDQNGRDYGYELTFFRRGIKNPWATKNPSRWLVQDLYLAHFAVTDVSEKFFHFEEKISRAALGKAGAETGKLSVWIDAWKATWQADQENAAIHLDAGKGGLEIDLMLFAEKPLVIHGQEGISRKGEKASAASHYYSFTKLRTKGSIRVNGQKMQVTGWSWMDHEFSSSLLGENQAGWDWFSIQLDDDTEYMFYQLRRMDGRKDPASSGTVILKDGTTRHLSSDEFLLTPIATWKSPESGADYPVSWKIEVPSERLVLISKPLVSNQELITSKSTRVTYWEGASAFSGKKGKQTIAGKGYVELTGYAEKAHGRTRTPLTRSQSSAGE